MSTSTQTAPLGGFAEAGVAELPKLACIGYVDEVPEGKLSESQNYVVQPVKLRASGPGRGVTHRILYRPEWLDAGFKPESLEEEFGDAGKSMTHVYRRNIAVRGGVSALKGLAGSDTGFTNLAQGLISLPEKSIAAVRNVLNDFLTITNEEVQIGYILKQRKDHVGEDENGKKVYENANGYEVDEFFFVNADNVKRLKQRAAKSNGKFVIAFDDEQ